MNEFELIASLTRDLASNPGLIRGPGDDCAVVDVGIPDRWMLFKTDAVVEGVHFTKSAHPEQIGHKALARCLSDIAAMAGSPQSAVITLGLPADFDSDFLQGVYRGLNNLARRFGMSIAGGETTRSPEGFWISVAVIGTVPKDRCVFRSGAQAGDAIFVSGELGGSIQEKHLTFMPRIDPGRWLSEKFEIHSMIDLSDGLAGDLRHILHSSGGLGAELLASAIPVSRAARERAREPGARKTPLVAALTDGEDFELLFTVASRDAVPLLDAWKQANPEIRVTCIGKITSDAGLRIRDQDGVREIGLSGFQHFK